MDRGQSNAKGEMNMIKNHDNTWYPNKEEIKGPPCSSLLIREAAKKTYFFETKF